MARYCANVPIILVACKSDLRGAQGVDTSLLVAREEGEEMAQRIGAWKYLECSAKTRDGIQHVFETAARAALLRPSRKGHKRCVMQ